MHLMQQKMNAVILVLVGDEIFIIFHKAINKLTKVTRNLRGTNCSQRTARLKQFFGRVSMEICREAAKFIFMACRLMTQRTLANLFFRKLFYR